MKYMVGFHSHTECSVASTVSPGVLEQLVAVRGEMRERVTHYIGLIRPSVAQTSFDDPISGWGGLVPGGSWSIIRLFVVHNRHKWFFL